MNVRFFPSDLRVREGFLFWFRYQEKWKTIILPLATFRIISTAFSSVSRFQYQLYGGGSTALLSLFHCVRLKTWWDGKVPLHSDWTERQSLSSFNLFFGPFIQSSSSPSASSYPGWDCVELKRFGGLDSLFSSCILSLLVELPGDLFPNRFPLFPVPNSLWKRFCSMFSDPNRGLRTRKRIDRESTVVGSLGVRTWKNLAEFQKWI